MSGGVAQYRFALTTAWSEPPLALSVLFMVFGRRFILGKLG